jgi:DNA-directed RNA polymerase specialized sigma24 family protein
MAEFTELYERRADYVFFLCSRLEMNEEKAQFLFHDVWRRIYRQLPQLRGSHEAQWLCRKLLDSQRRLHRHTYEGVDGGFVAGMSAEARLAQSIMALSLEYRWPLVLREFAGFSYEEICRVLDVPIGTVRARLARARILVRRFQEEHA